MIQIALIGMVLTSNLADTTEMVVHSRPHMTAQRARNLARWINRSADRHHIEPSVLVGILAQESYFQTGVVRENVRRQPNGCTKKVTHDVGIAQINWEAWNKRLNLNYCRLRMDDAYGIEQAARILEIVRKQEDDDGELAWWSRYHDARPDRRLIYEALVERRLD